MWSRQNRSERIVQRIAGGALLLALIVLPFASESASPGVVSAQLLEGARSTLTASDRTLRIEVGDTKLSAMEGTEVYERLSDGTGRIVGRVHRDGEGHFLVLSSDAMRRYGTGADLLFARPTYNLGDAIDVILAPDGAEKEFEIARDQLWPVVEREIVMPLQAEVEIELRKAISEYPLRQQETLSTVANEALEKLTPQFNALGERMFARAWQEIGVGGVLNGAWRKTSEAAANAYESSRDWVVGLFSEDKGGDRTEKDFLDEETKEALQKAMREELDAFWKEHGTDVLARTGEVLERHEARLLQPLRDELLPRLYERAIGKLWIHRQSPVLEAVNQYGMDMAERRLTTAKKGPQLTLAYAVRSGTFITARPLLVIQASNDRSGKLHLKPYVTHLNPAMAPDRLGAAAQ